MADDQGLSWAGAIGLYLFLSVPPFMVAIAYLGQILTPHDQARAFIVEQVAKYLPADTELLEGIVERSPDNVAAGAVAVALLLFSGTRAFAALTSAINVMWRRVDRLTIWRRQILRLGMLGVALLLLAGAALSEAGLAAVLRASSSSESGHTWLVDWQILPAVQLVALLTVAYKVLPREAVAWRNAAVGALIATLGVRAAQAVLGAIAESGLFQTPYGDLAGVAVLATWALVFGVIVLFGAAIVAVLGGKTTENREGGEGRFSR